MKIKTDGLVIREQHLGESDRLITLLTREKGVVRAFATGARSIKGRRQAATQLLCYGNYMLNDYKNTYRVNEAEPVEVFFELRGEIEKLSLAQYFCELCSVLAPREENAEEYLRLVLNTLHLLAAQAIPRSRLKAVFELRILTLSGYMPDLSGCSVCGKTHADGMYLDIPEGQLLCPDHAADLSSAAFAAPSVLAAMRHITDCELERIFYFDLPESRMKELGDLCESFLKYQLNRTFTTLEFYHSLNDPD